MQLFNELF